MIKVNGKEVEFIEFPNKEIQIKTDSLPKEGWIIQSISFKFEDNSDLIKLMLVKNYIDSQHRGDYGNLIIYYMPYSRMDRSENDSPFTLKYISNFINSLGFKKVTVIEPHSDVTCALLNNVEAKYVNFDLLPLVMYEIGFDEFNDYIMFPDLGASRRYKDMSTSNIIIGHKVRDFQTGKILGLDLIGDLSTAKDGRKVIIVDDLSSYGGTFVHSSKKLRESGFNEVYLLVAHSENSVFKGELFRHIDKLFTTDSILTEQNNLENKKFESQLKVFNIEDVIKW